ncbi:MAG: PAS domain-containing protein [Candidatus Hydrogenedentes bacterium]|nr:PAS domain-containing protein [Candidatus Hydrogenedentota bacterium]
MDIFRELVDGQGDPVVCLRDDGCVTYINAAGVAVVTAAPLQTVKQDIKIPSELLAEIRRLQAEDHEGMAGYVSLRTPAGLRHFEVRVKRSPGPDGAEWLVLLRNVTELRIAQRASQYRSAFAKLVSEVASRFAGAGLDEFDDAIEESLERIGIFAQADASYLFQFSERGDRMSVTHSWSSGRVAPLPEQLHDIDAQTMTWWMSRLHRAEVVALSSLTELPEEAQVERRILAAQGVGSLVDVPLTYKGVPIGFMGLSSAEEGRHWSQDEVHLLSIVGQVFTNALQHKRAEEALAQERNLLRTLIDNLPDYIYAKDAESRFILNNSAHLRLLRAKSPEDVAGKSDYDMFPRELASQYYEDEQEIIRSGHPLVNREESVITEEGERRWLLTTKVPLCDADGVPVGLVGMSRDITGRKQMAEALETHARLLEQANADLRMRNQELDEFTYIASHDLQEPLRKLVSFTDALQHDMKAGDAAEIRRDLDIIASAAQRMQRLVRDLLALSRSGRQAMEWELVDLNECVDLALDALEIRMGEEKAEFAKEKLPTVLGDRTLLTQLFQNLIGNALKFHGPDAPQVRLTAEEGDDGWVLGVQDNGIGIKQEYSEQIFAPFKRLHGRGSYEGTGIGLAICRKIVERHGGVIWVESEPGKGAHFKFSLPQREAEQSP